MLLRCAARTLGAPVMLGAGLLAATAVATAAVAGAGIIGAGLLARRCREERQGWREGAAEEPSPPPPLGPVTVE